LFKTLASVLAYFGQRITEYDPASKGFKDFHKLARELMGPQPRMTLNLGAVQPRAIPAETLEPESTESILARAQEAVEETLETIQDGIELSEPVETPPGMRRSSRVAAQDLKAQADLLTRRADEVLMAARQGMGIAISSRPAVTTAQKIEEFYGVRQVPEGLLFVAHFPNAQNVSIAGDFNGWTPDRMAADGERGGPDDTFRALMALKPGRYRYRLIVDGRWQADPHNVYSEPNPFGELDSIVEVV
jgi:hypothetical protein